MEGERGEGVEEEGGELGDVVEDEGVLPDHEGQAQAAQGERVVGEEPGDGGGGEPELGQGGQVDGVAEVQHEQLALLSPELGIPEENGIKDGNMSREINTALRQELTEERRRNM